MGSSPLLKSEGIQFTLAICTRNRGVQLRATLEAVDQLDIPGDCTCECLIVDNGSTDSSAAIVAEFTRRSPTQFRATVEPTAGLSRARNRALRESNGEVVIFIDDDATPEPGFLYAYATAYRNRPNVGCVGGRIVLALPAENIPAWFGPELHGLLSAFDLPYGSLQECRDFHEFPFGANISFHRQTALDAGGFDQELGYRGARLVGGEEQEFCQRLQRCGARILFQPDAVVRHHIQLARIERRYFRRLAWANGIVWIMLARRAPASPSTARLFFRHASRAVQLSPRAVFSRGTLSRRFYLRLQVREHLSSAVHALDPRCAA